MDIDLKKVGPVGNGYVTCVSIFSGPEFDYGLGDGPGTTLWIDNLDESADLVQVFKPWFEDPTHFKVWHNYGFDRHVMFNENIDVKGFGGDTMHMARLQNTHRLKSGLGGYSLEALSADLLKKRKRPMKEIFGVARLRKDGTRGSLVDIPPVEELQRRPEFRENWIIYSCYDAQCTWYLHSKLRNLLQKMSWVKGHNLYDYYWSFLRDFGEVLTDMERRGIRVNASDYLATIEITARKDRDEHVEAFRKWCASRIGPDGLAINPSSSTQLTTLLFGGGTNSKTGEESERVRVFKVPREDVSEAALKAYEERDKLDLKSTYDSKDEFDFMTVVQLKVLCKERGLKVSGKKADLQERLRGHFLSPESSHSSSNELSSMSVVELRNACRSRNLDDKGRKDQLISRLQEDIAFSLELISAHSNSVESSTGNDGYSTISEALNAALDQDTGMLKDFLESVREKSTESKYIEVKIESLGLEPLKYTMGGAPSVTSDVLKKLAGDPLVDEPRYGTAYEALGGGEAGHDACVALYSLHMIGSIETMIANFLLSLQYLADDQSRVHCSLNLNTETGRLSSRRPNLQNQPALEKDTYKIRQAFEASPGNSLIVADYGQLELRILASMTNCTSMIEAFREGGDFHSRTAMGMFNYIEEKVESGDILFEWDYSQGSPPKPLLKDVYASERRKAKTLNFSIAYGKTAHGLSQDWGVSVTEAETMLQAWYDSRPEVLKWQTKMKELARKKGITRTLMGRYRQLPEALEKRNRKLLGGAERASINTPIQGGAADIAMAAMIKVNNSDKLKRLGWIMILQVHDEIILEGPEETAEEAFEEVLQCMESPWVFGLEETQVPLIVDGSYQHKNWYDAK
mmetsp:Transcript_24500/g.55961  ORF Transcript_24500/g.55961 Transcript_24500/m.55961 type:complete len:859 (+) Transcript_24500:1720-4296(+)